MKQFSKEKIPDILPGDTVKVFQKIKEKDKERTQIFEGVVLAKKHKKEIGATITVRKVVGGVGVERIFPLHLPTIEKIEVVRRSKVRRAKLYYLRTAKGKRARLKRKELKKPAEAKKEIKKPSVKKPEEKPEEKAEMKKEAKPKKEDKKIEAKK